jgi:homoserine kinase
VIVRVPASSANLGPGFDTLGMALSLHLEASDAQTDGFTLLDEHHPTTIAHRLVGGTGEVWVRSPIPIGRGMGFSGAARIAGLVLAVAQRAGGFELDQAGAEVMEHATALEGHADNVAASLYGGVVATIGTTTVRVPLGFDPAVVCWVPDFQTSTDASRKALPDQIALKDAVFNIARTAMLVAAFADGDTDALREATGDRIHQSIRFEQAQPSRVALDAGLDAGAWCGWLSGSGPTVALLCPSNQAERIAGSLPADGHAKLLRIDHSGAVVE